MKTIYVLTEQRPRAATTDTVIHFTCHDRTPLEEMVLSLYQEVEYETFSHFCNECYSLVVASSMSKYHATQYANRFKIIPTQELEGIYNE